MQKNVWVTQLCQLFGTLWTVAHQAPLCMEYFRQDYWSGLLFPFPVDLPDSGIKPMSPASLALQWILYHLSHQGNP